MGRNFGTYLRKRRLARQKDDAKLSVRGLAGRIGVEPSYLSKVERGIEAPPSEEKIRAMARELGDDPDALLALAGKVSADLQAIIMKRPELFASLLRHLKDMPDHAVLRIARDGLCARRSHAAGDIRRRIRHQIMGSRARKPLLRPHLPVE